MEKVFVKVLLQYLIEAEVKDWDDENSFNGIGDEAPKDGWYYQEIYTSELSAPVGPFSTIEDTKMKAKEDIKRTFSEHEVEIHFYSKTES